MKSLFGRIRHHVVPTQKNGGNPYLLRLEVMGLVLMIVLASQAFLFSETLRSAFSSSVTSVTNLANVLPSVLAVETNDYRASNAVPALRENPLLDEAAQMKAQDMAARSYFSHIGPNGEKPWTWLQKVGYSYTFAGENLAIDFSESRDVTDAWIKSPTHRANLVNANYTDVGIGTADGMYQGKETTFVVQFFATPPSAGNAPSSPASAERSALAVVPHAVTRASAGNSAVAVRLASSSAASRSSSALAASSPALTGSQAASSSPSSLKDRGVVLGLDTEPSSSTVPAAVGQISGIVPRLSAGQALFADIFLSPRQGLVRALGAVSLVFVLIVVVSLAHAASRHESPRWADRLGHAAMLHRKLALRVACFALILLGVAAIDSRSYSAPVQISMSWNAAAASQN